MGSMSLVHWALVALVVILLFGGSRFSNMMGDVAKGLKNFKKGMADEDEKPVVGEPTRIEAQKAAEPAFKAAEPAFKTEAERTREER